MLCVKTFSDPVRCPSTVTPGTYVTVWSNKSSSPSSQMGAESRRESPRLWGPLILNKYFCELGASGKSIMFRVLSDPSCVSSEKVLTRQN